MSDGYLSKNRAYLNQLQRIRRKHHRRIDYYASPAALELIEARRAEEHPDSQRATNSAVLDAIVREWGELAGINNQQIEMGASD